MLTVTFALPLPFSEPWELPQAHSPSMVARINSKAKNRFISLSSCLLLFQITAVSSPGSILNAAAEGDDGVEDKRQQPQTQAEDTGQAEGFGHAEIDGDIDDENDQCQDENGQQPDSSIVIHDESAEHLHFVDDAIDHGCQNHGNCQGQEEAHPEPLFGVCDFELDVHIVDGDQDFPSALSGFVEDLPHAQNGKNGNGDGGDIHDHAYFLKGFDEFFHNFFSPLSILSLASDCFSCGAEFPDGTEQVQHQNHGQCKYTNQQGTDQLDEHALEGKSGDDFAAQVPAQGDSGGV